MKKRLVRRITVLLVSFGLLFSVIGCGSQWEELKNRVLEAEKIIESKRSDSIGQSEHANATETTGIIKETEEDIPVKEVVGISEGNYAYTTLKDEVRTVYDEIVDAILKQEEKVDVSTLEVDILEEAYRAVCADYGGFFWVSGYVYTQYTRGGKMVGMEFSPKYTMSYEERMNYQTQIDSSVEELLGGISAQDSDYAKAKYVFEILIQNVDYDAASDNNQNIISVFLNRSTVCQGYACATQYLLRLLGVESTIVNGTANGEAHAWNLVKLDGEYYYMDTTWGNSRYSDDSSQTAKYVNYNYLAVTSEEISRTHVLDTSFILPECTALADNYFVQEGKYFAQWEPDKIGTVLGDAWNAGLDAVSVKFSSPELYAQAMTYFIDEQHIADYCSSISSVYYLEDSEQYVLTMNFSKN